MTVQDLYKNILAKVRSRTREEWANALREGRTEVRIWMQEHGEKAAIIAFSLGLLIALAFKLFVGLAVLAVLLGYVVWYLAPPATPPSRPPAESAQSSESPKNDNESHVQ